MRPPIASPHGESYPNRKSSSGVPLTKKVEWNAERDCFVLRYRISFWGRLRGETYLGIQLPWLIPFIPLNLPIVAFSLIIAIFAQRYKQPHEFSVFSWGIEYTATEATYRTEWKNVGKILIHNEDFFVMLEPFTRGSYCLPRENFMDAMQASCLQNIAESLQAQNGANWEMIRDEFKAKCSIPNKNPTS